MTFYEQELRKLFADGTVIGSPKFTGRACLGTLGKDLRARVPVCDIRPRGPL